MPPLRKGIHYPNFRLASRESPAESGDAKAVKLPSLEVLSNSPLALQPLPKLPWIDWKNSKPRLLTQLPKNPKPIKRKKQDKRKTPKSNLNKKDKRNKRKPPQLDWFFAYYLNSIHHIIMYCIYTIHLYNISNYIT